MDGTLLDSMWMWRTVLTKFLAQLNIPNYNEINEACCNMYFAEAMAYTVEHAELNMTADELYDELERYIFHLYKTEIQMKPFVKDYLEILHEKGVKICLATLTDRYMVEAVLTRLDLIRYFDYIVTVPEIGLSKEHPDIYENCLKNVGVKKEDAVVFEDAPYCLKTVHDAGFCCYAIEDPWQQFPEGFTEKYCDRFVRSYSELLDEAQAF